MDDNTTTRQRDRCQTEESADENLYLWGTFSPFYGSVPIQLVLRVCTTFGSGSCSH